MELETSKYYYIKDDKLTNVRDLMDIPVGEFFVFVSTSYHFGQRHLELMAVVIREESKEGNNPETIYNKLIELCH